MKDFRFLILWSDYGEITLYSAAFAAQTHILSDASALMFFPKKSVYFQEIHCGEQYIYKHL